MLEKAKTIAKAFLEPLPEGKDWYENRLKICSTCPYNTANIPKGQLKLKDKLKMKSGLCDNNNHCTACGCCIERKAATKSENCGLEKLYMEPKWKALAAQSNIQKDIFMENMTPEAGEIIVEDKQFTYDFGETTENRLQFKFRIKRLKAKLEIKNYRPGCNCTSVDSISEIDENTTEFSVSISTKAFRKGWNSRKLYILYHLTPQKAEEITINLKVNKPDGK